MNIRTCLIVLAAFLFSVTYAAPLKSNALVSEIVPSTIGQKSVAPSILDTLRDVYIANPIDTISPRTVADDSIAPIHTVALSARVNDMTTGISKNMTSPAAISAPDTEPHWKNSLQILFREHQGYFSWYMYQGPQGIPVNPCGDNRFAIITGNYRENRKGLSLMEPPMVGEGTKWYINTMDGCRIAISAFMRRRQMIRDIWCVATSSTFRSPKMRAITRSRLGVRVGSGRMGRIIGLGRWNTRV
jgi:hypothetical protein